MKLVILIISLLINKFNICNAANSYPSSNCIAHTDNCDNWCDDQEGSNGGNCWLTDWSATGCFLSKRCYCQCYWKKPLSDTTVSAPFEIKASFNGKCLDWYQDGTNNIGLHDCHGGNNQKWVYFPNGGALKSLKADNGVNNCFHVRGGVNTNGQDVGIWSHNDCVNFEYSQWTFLADGQIKTHLGNKYLDIRHADTWAQIWDWNGMAHQKFIFPAGTLRGSSGGECQINKLEQVAEESTDELAETAWNLGTTVASMIPKVGPAISIITSIWDPTANDGPSATELVNNVRNEMNVVVDQLKQCMDIKIRNLWLEYEKDQGARTVTGVMARLAHIHGASGDDYIDSVDDLFEDFNVWVAQQFKEQEDYVAYENLIPIYESLLPLWSAVSYEQLGIQKNQNDCNNFQNDLRIIRAGFGTMYTWIKKAINAILLSTIKISADDNKYNEWVNDQRAVFDKKYLAPIEYYIESLDDVSPNLELSCTSDGKFQETDHVITINKYTWDVVVFGVPILTLDITLSANPSSATIQGRGYVLNPNEIYKLYDNNSTANTAPVYKKYQASTKYYLISTDKDAGSDEDYKLISVLGYCSTLPDNTPVTSCDVLRNI